MTATETTAAETKTDTTNVAGTIKTVATDVAARLPEVATTSRTVIERANREMQGGSDELLVVGSALTFGLAGGLLIGGGHRLLVAAALMPAAMMLLTVFERSVRLGERSRPRPQGS